VHDDTIEEANLAREDLERALTSSGVEIHWSGYMGVSDSFDQWLRYRILRLPVLAADLVIRRLLPGWAKRRAAFHLMCVGVKPQE
jgi:hypothetical protein